MIFVDNKGILILYEIGGFGVNIGIFVVKYV